MEAGTCPKELWVGEKARMWQEFLRIKNIIRPFKIGNSRPFLSIYVLPQDVNKKVSKKRYILIESGHTQTGRFAGKSDCSVLSNPAEVFPEQRPHREYTSVHSTQNIAR